MIPPGSLPGMINFATAPITSPIINVHSRCINLPPRLDGLLLVAVVRVRSGVVWSGDSLSVAFAFGLWPLAFDL